ncbi:MAG: PfkB family carbohydrate kinase [Saprospiraceae bacterium]
MDILYELRRDLDQQNVSLHDFSAEKGNYMQDLDFSGLHVLVIGDVMLDRYMIGDVTRISPEAPVPVLNLSKIEDRPGGAANVTMNLQALGMDVTLLSVTGDDSTSTKLEELLGHSIGIHFIKAPGRKTSLKTRFMAGTQHLMRVDDENSTYIDAGLEDVVIDKIQTILNHNDVHAIVFQDYNKGILTANLISKIITIANENKIPTFVDPKEKNFLAYKNCTVFKPNKKEIETCSGIYSPNLETYDTWLRSHLSHQLTCLTLGSKGLYLHNGTAGKHFDTKMQEIVDVCGAGDTVLALLVGCFLKNFDMNDLGKILNIAGGQVCKKSGVAIIDFKELNSEYSLS